MFELEVHWKSPGAAMLRNIGLAACIGWAGSGCAMLYPELSTPLRGPVSEDHYDPPPPKDVVYVAIKSARIPPKTRDGRSWDKMGGAAPDVFALLFVDDVETLRTPTISNNFRPEWAPGTPVNLKIPESARVRVEMWDDNALVSHPICNQGVHNLVDSAAVGNMEIECESGAALLLTVEPPKSRMGIGLFYEVRGKEAFVSRVIHASSAGRAGLMPGDQIVSVDGRPVGQMATGELASVINGNSRNGLAMEIRGADGGKRQISLRDEPMYPLKGEGIDLLLDANSRGE